MSGGEVGKGKVVCVTGASGYIASWLVKLLLHRGYTVNATVRSLNDPRKTEHLLALDGAKERLHLFEADLIEEGSFDSAIEGCEGVFHTASPVFLSVADPQTELIDPAVKGTLNVLKSCTKVSSIKRVVVTSSMASVMHTGTPLKPDVVIDETWFSDPVLCEKSKFLSWRHPRSDIHDHYYFSTQVVSSSVNAVKKDIHDHWNFSIQLSTGVQTMSLATDVEAKIIMNHIVSVVTNYKFGMYQSWYPLAKTLAEDAGSKFSKENGIDLVTIHPGYVIGPILQPTLNLTSEGILNLIKTGKDVFPDGIYRLVDIRDVVYAHIFAFEVPSASGRYCLVGTVTYSSEIIKILNKLYPALNLPERRNDNKPGEHLYQVSKERAKRLGVDFTPLEVSVKDTVESLVEKKFLTL